MINLFELYTNSYETINGLVERGNEKGVIYFHPFRDEQLPVLKLKVGNTGNSSNLNREYYDANTIGNVINSTDYKDFSEYTLSVSKSLFLSDRYKNEIIYSYKLYEVDSNQISIWDLMSAA